MRVIVAKILCVYLSKGCRRPMSDSIANGGIDILETNFEVGSMLTYTCSPGFDTNDPVLTVCGDSFFWSLDDNPPTCSTGNHAVKQLHGSLFL